MKAFTLAMQQGADGIELDIRQCKSGEMVVIHDTTLERTTGKKGIVKDYTLEQLQQFDAGDGEKIQEISYVINRFRGRIRLFLEIKEQECAVPLAELVSVYCEEQHCDYDDIVIISGLHSALAMVHRFNPQLFIGANLNVSSQRIADVIQYTGAKFLLPEYSIITPRMVEDCNSMGTGVIAWTINEPSAMQRLEMFGIKSIITDYPTRFLKKK